MNSTPDLSGYDEIALVLQGGGALGSYQAGVYQALYEAGVEPTWITGTSIGALNSAIIAGNAPADRVSALNGFWEAISNPIDPVAHAAGFWLRGFGLDAVADEWSSARFAARSILQGETGFFRPQSPVSVFGLHQRSASQVSYYDCEPLEQTLTRFADFERINSGPLRVSIGAVDVATGNLAHFDNRRMHLTPRHFLASGALPPGFPAVEIDGRFYWDGGLVSNTPLIEVLDDAGDRNLLAFQVDLWSASGPLPGSFADIEGRMKDIRFSSRTRATTDMLAANRRKARIIRELVEHLPEAARSNNRYVDAAREFTSCGKVNLFHLIYRNKPYERYYRDFEFGRDSMRIHWASGFADMTESVSRRDWFRLPDSDLGFVTHDIHHDDTAIGAERR